MLGVFVYLTSWHGPDLLFPATQQCLVAHHLGSPKLPKPLMNLHPAAVGPASGSYQAGDVAPEMHICVALPLNRQARLASAMAWDLHVLPINQTGVRQVL